MKTEKHKSNGELEYKMGNEDKSSKGLEYKMGNEDGLKDDLSRKEEDSNKGLEYSMGSHVMRVHMGENLRKANNYSDAENKVKKMLEKYEILGDISILPDFTDSNSLPIGTTAIIGSNQAINPALIGIDIGCGYQFVHTSLNSKRFYKKGKFKYDSSKKFVDFLSDSLQVGRKSKNLLGTIGGGNHFVNAYVIEELYNSELCFQNGIDEKKVYFLIHSGSREKGFETYSEFSKKFKELENPHQFNSDYLNAFNDAKNYARANRDSIRILIKKALEQDMNNPIILDPIFDTIHNDIQVEDTDPLTYKIKKGTASLKEGGLFVVPGTAVDPAYVVVGQKGLSESHNTINHGCGRKYTRKQTSVKFRGKNFSHIFKDVALNVDSKKMVEEIPKAYKNIEDIIDTVEEYGLAKRIAKLKPVGVIVERK